MLLILRNLQRIRLRLNKSTAQPFYTLATAFENIIDDWTTRYCVKHRGIAALRKQLARYAEDEKRKRYGNKGKGAGERRLAR